LHIVAESISARGITGVAFRPFHDGPEPISFSAVWSPYNQSQTLRHLLDLARKLGQRVIS
jgi:hypothetical protein